MTWLALLCLALLVALMQVSREFIALRTVSRQRGFFRRWPIRKVTIESLDPRFEPDALGPTLAAEVNFIGRGSKGVPGGTSDTEAWILAVLARDATRMFEFGTCTGKTTYLWARNIRPGGTVTTLTLGPDQVNQYQVSQGDDEFATRYAKMESVFTSFLYTGTEVESRITQLYGDSKDVRRDAVRRQLRCERYSSTGAACLFVRCRELRFPRKAMRIVKPGGIVLWHDYNSAMVGVFRALNELSGSVPLVHVMETNLVAWRRPA